MLEDRLRAHPLISQCMVVGDAQAVHRRAHHARRGGLPAWAAAHGKGEPAPAALRDDPDLLAEIQGAVDEANKAVSKAEAIKKFRILPVDFTEEGGQLTPTLKLKRAVVMKDFEAEVDALYS